MICTIEDWLGNPPSRDDIEEMAKIGIDVDPDTGEFEADEAQLIWCIGNDDIDWRGIWSDDPRYCRLLSDFKTEELK
tara:strand:+ start:650 stop:880 length:231 start_codon:yes stop_codon:yes gene_type:complete